MVKKYAITVGGAEYLVELGDVSTSPVEVIVNGEPKTVAFKEIEAASAAAAAPTVAAAPKQAPAPVATAAPAGDVAGQVVTAPMPGKILSVAAKVGDAIAQGATVCTLEAMKMEMPISSSAAGTVRAVHVKVGDTVAYDDPLVTVG